MRFSPLLGIPLLFVCLLFSGCHSTSGTVSRDPVAYLQISQAREGCTVIIDDLPPARLIVEKGQARVQVAPGRHRVRILLNGSTLVDRVVLVSDLQTLEITAP